MNSLLLMTWEEVRESVRAKWFFVYLAVFGGAVVLLFTLRVTESQVLGFTGISRLLLTYIQLSIAVLPIFILITTVRAVVGDRESNVLEYFLSMPITLASYYWGKLLGRFVIVFLPVSLTLLAAAGWGAVKGLAVPWAVLGYYSLLLAVLAWCFLGAGILISTIARRQESALGLAFLVWLVALLFIDIVLIGIMIQQRFSEEIIIGIAVLNPLQSFRTAAILLFDPSLTVMGPAANVILDSIGRFGFLVYALLYPFGLGWVLATIGFYVFRRGDLIC